MEFRPSAMGELRQTMGFTHHSLNFSKPIGIATYQTLRTIPKPYRELAPVIEGVRKALMEPPEASGPAGR